MSRRALLCLALLASAAAGCAPVAPGASAPPAMGPPPAPASSPACSPGWQLGPAGTCLREPSNFGGPPIYLGPQA